MKGVGDREILETCLNSASKIHQKHTFFLMGQIPATLQFVMFLYLFIGGNNTTKTNAYSKK
jgi:hypothetical protein